MERKVRERNIEMICKKKEHGKEDRKKEHGNDMQGRGTWKGFRGERNMEKMCRREEHGKEGMREEHEEGAQRQSHNKKLKQKPSLLNLFTHH